MPKRNTHILPNLKKGGWDIKHSDSERSSGHFETKEEAITRAKEICESQDTKLVIHNKDGKVAK